MKSRLILITIILGLGFNLKAKEPKLIEVLLIKNNNDTVFVKSKAKYQEEYSFNSFGYYNEDGSRGRADASEYKLIIIGDKRLESVKLKSTVKKDCDKQVFLERIIDGPMIMYIFHYVKEMVYTSKCIDEVFIRKSDEECAYPIYKELCEHERANLTMIKQPGNSEDMLRLFSDVPEIIEGIKSGYYIRSDFEEMILKYNECMKGKEI